MPFEIMFGRHLEKLAAKWPQRLGTCAIKPYQYGILGSRVEDSKKSTKAQMITP